MIHLNRKRKFGHSRPSFAGQVSGSGCKTLTFAEQVSGSGKTLTFAEQVSGSGCKTLTFAGQVSGSGCKTLPIAGPALCMGFLDLILRWQRKNRAAKQ